MDWLGIIVVVGPILFGILAGLGGWLVKLRKILSNISEVLDVATAADSVIDKANAAMEDGQLTEDEIREVAAALVELKKQFDEAKAILGKKNA